MQLRKFSFALSPKPAMTLYVASHRSHHVIVATSMIQPIDKPPHWRCTATAFTKHSAKRCYTMVHSFVFAVVIASFHILAVNATYEGIILEDKPMAYLPMTGTEFNGTVLTSPGSPAQNGSWPQFVESTMTCASFDVVIG
jgi:hypothetical protein